jgi:hypothetical protein
MSIDVMFELRVVDTSALVATAVWLAAIGLVVVLALGGTGRTVSFGWRFAKRFLSFENRWRLLLTQVVATGGPFALVLVLDPNVDGHSDFFQTAAQTEAGLLVTLALTNYSDHASGSARGVRPSVILAVVLGAVALAAALAGTSPLMEPALLRWAFACTVAGIAGTVLSLVLVSWRLLR